MQNFLAFKQFARKVKQGLTPASAPSPPQYALHQLTVTSVDVFSGVADVQFADGTSVPRVRFVQPYSSASPPSVGDTAWVEQYGTDFRITGQHVVPTNFVTPT